MGSIKLQSSEREDEMKVAILGTGFGAYHVELLKKVETVEAICVFGRNPEKLAALKEKFNVDTTTDMESIWRDRNVELVDVCLPGPLHRDAVIRSLENGKHVYCETPFALTQPDARTMAETARQSGKMACVDLFLRFEMPYVYLHEKYARQIYGPLKSFRIFRKTPPIWGDLGPANIVTNLMIHDIDFVTWLCGRPLSVQASLVPGQPGQCAVIGRMHYDNCFVEVTGSSMMPVSSPFAVGYEAVFEDAVIQYFEDGYPDRVVNALQVFTTAGVEKMEIPQENCFEKAIRHAVECAQHGVQPIHSMGEAAVSIEAALDMQAQIII